MNIDLNPEEVHLIKNALTYVSQNKLDKINKYEHILSPAEIKETKKMSDKYHAVFNKIDNWSGSESMICECCQEIVCDCDGN